MNLVDCVVTEILEPPFEDEFEDAKWWAVSVNANCHGNIFYRVLGFKTEEEAGRVVVGYTFLG